jgi:AraC-like DNA-binding protein
MKYEYQAKVEQLESKKAQVSKLSEVAKKIGNQIYHDVNVSKLLYYKNPNIFDMSVAFSQLRTYRLTIPYIESIYVYNKLNDYIYVDASSDYSELTMNGYTKQVDGFPDSSANQMIGNYKDYRPYRPIGRIYQTVDNGITVNNCFYTYFIYDAYTKTDKTNCVIINFNTDYLIDSSELIINNNSEYFILDENGVVVSNTSDLEMMKNYSEESYIKNIIQNKNKPGYFTDEVKGEKKLFVYSERDQYGWQYVSMTNYDSLLKSMNFMQMLTFLLSIFFVGLGIMIAILVTKKIYHPIGKMETDISNLKIEKRSVSNILKRIYINELVANKHSDNLNFIEEYFVKMNMNVDFAKNLALVLIKLDNYRNLIERNETEIINAYKFAIINIFEEALEDEYTINGADMGEDEVLLFVSIDFGTDINHFAERLQTARSIYTKYFNMTFTMMISSIDIKADQLSFLYHQVMEASMHRVFYEQGTTIFADWCNQKQASEYEYPLAKEKQLVEALMSGKMEEVKDIYQYIISELNEYPISIFNMVIAKLVVTLNKTISMMRVNSINTNYTSLLLHNVDSSEELTKQFYDFFDMVGNELEKRKIGKQDALMDKIRNLIEMSYTDSNFSVEAIANSVNKSISYISRIYTQHNGISINDKINELRMAKAKQLLKNKNMPISEIALKVGFSSASYFHKAFKKFNGVTPKVYQENDMDMKQN